MARRAAAVLAASILAAGAAQAQTPPVWQSWIARLQSEGYTVTQGTALAFTPQQCQATVFTVFHTCFNTDSQDLYVQPEVPVGAGYVDPYYGPATSMTLPDGTLVGSTFQLATTEALVTVVNLPPQGAYFSYQNYMFTRPLADYPGGVQKVSPDPARAVVFGSYSNSIDSVRIAAQSGLGFGQGTVGMISTPNAFLARALGQNFAAVGGNTAQLFADGLPPTVSPGLGAQFDDFSAIFRYLAPSTSAGADWRANAAANIAVYRIGAPPGTAVTRFGDAVISAKSANAKEASHAANVAELAGLLQGWLSTQEGKPVTVIQAPTGEGVNATGEPVSGEFGPFCISQGHDCAGDSQDTDSYKYVPIGTLPTGHAYMVAGVDHTVTNNTTYLGISAEDASTDTGVAEPYQVNATAAGFAAGSITGSAQAALIDLGLYGSASPSLIADLPNLYVQVFARPCDASVAYCNKSYTTLLPQSLIPLVHKVSVWERAYLLPGAPNGANPKVLLDPYVIY